MTMFVVMKIALIVLVMAQQSFGEKNVTIARAMSSSWSTPCLLQSPPVIKRNDYIYTPGIGGHKFHSELLTWNNARLACEAEGGYLAIINSFTESNILTDMFQKAYIGMSKKEDWASIGFHDLFQEGEYLTIHGQSLGLTGFSTWASGQPDNRWGGENCGTIYREGGLNDIRCELKYPFICELPVY